MLDDIALVEKSDVMEDHYKKSSDPWGNRESRLYQKVLKEAITQMYKFCNKSTIYHYDIGVGGGNILDVVTENKPDSVTELCLGGCDISESALEFIKRNYFTYATDLIDCEKFTSTDDNKMKYADTITIVDVMYYFGNVRDYRLTLDELWKTFKSGAIIVVADSIIPYQRRSYFKSKSDCKVLSEFTDYTVPVGKLNNTNKSRYLKIKIYQKM